MEAIKKKMQAMKVEKDNLCDRCDVVEQQDKDAKLRKEKAEEEFNELTLKARTLEIDTDKYGEKLTNQIMAQEAKEAQVMAAEAEFNRLNRRVQELEEDLETTELKYNTAIQKYDKAATEADDSDRMSKVLQNRATEDETKMVKLAEELKDAQKRAEDADRKYDECQKKMTEYEAKLDIDGERADVSEFKIIELEEELKVVANNLKSLEVSEDKANQRETFYKSEIKRLTAKLKQSETRAEFAERSVGKLQKEVDRLEDELVNEQDKFKAITEELDATFAEMSGY
jgi:chromosome segregation ATPase